MQIFLSALGIVLGGGVLGFIQFLINRKDKKEDRIGDLVKRVEALDNKISALDEKMGKRFNDIEDKAEEREAIHSRIRILDFSDELREGRKHTKEGFLQVLSDITKYEQYSESHPDFPNNQTMLTATYIKEMFHDRLEKNDFV